MTTKEVDQNTSLTRGFGSKARKKRPDKTAYLPVCRIIECELLLGFRRLSRDRVEHSFHKAIHRPVRIE